MGSQKIRLIVACILAAAMLVGESVAAYANGGGATVIKDEECWLLAADSGLDVDLTSTDLIMLTTPSGNTVLICHFDIPEGHEPDKAIKKTGWLGYTIGGFTANTQSVVTPGGKAVVRCEIKAHED